MWSRLVSSFFTDTAQQIHSLRASGVMSFHVARAASLEKMAVRTSCGSVCMYLYLVENAARRLLLKKQGKDKPRNGNCAGRDKEWKTNAAQGDVSGNQRSSCL